ncbi:MAG: hypothetical protein ACHQU1_09200 [Gemmatimonadales bacterium]
MNRFYWLALLVAWAAVVIWIRRRENRVSSSVQTSQPPGGAKGSGDGIDREELERAEREVKDLRQDVRGRPLDDVVGDDWGPGTPKPPYV